MYITDFITYGTFILILNLTILVIGLNLQLMRLDLLFTPIFIIQSSFFCSTVWFVLLSYNVFKTNPSYIFILENSGSFETLFYKFGSIWSSKEGSLSLWLWLMNSVITFVLLHYKRILNIAYLYQISYLFIKILAVFTFVLLYFNNPHTPFYLYTNFVGAGITLLLKDFLLIIHPPLLYTGYIISSIGFGLSYLVADQQKVNRDYNNLFFQSNDYTAFFLLIGISLGSFWSYQELGWGGFWNWDPVENLAILPLLLTLSLIHLKSISLQKLYLQYRLYTSLIIFFTCFLGTLYIRAGILVSIHSFALSSLGVNVALLLITSYFLSYIILFIHGQTQMIIDTESITFFKKVINLTYIIFILILVTILISVLTFLPYCYKHIFELDISIGSQLYNDMLLYLSLPSLLILMWYYSTSWRALGLFNSAFLATFLFYSFYETFGFNSRIISQFDNQLFLLITLTISVLIYTSLKINKAALNLKAAFAHVGVLLLFLGVFLNFKQARTTFCNLKTNTLVDFSDYTIIGKNLTRITNNLYDIYFGKLYIFKKGLLLDIATPEKYFSKVSSLITTKPYIFSTLFDDLYIILYNITLEGIPQYIIHHYPGMLYIWLGFIIILFAFFIKKNNF